MQEQYYWQIKNYPAKKIATTSGLIMPTLFVIEPHAGMRNSILWWLSHTSPQYKAIGCNTITEALSILPENSADGFLISVDHSVARHLPEIKKLRTEYPDAHIILLTTFDDVDSHTQNTKIGITAQISKQKIHHELGALLQNMLLEKSSYINPNTE